MDDALQMDVMRVLFDEYYQWLLQSVKVGFNPERNFSGIHSLPFTGEHLLISTGHKSIAFSKFVKDRFEEPNIMYFEQITDRMKTRREPDWRVLS